MKAIRHRENPWLAWVGHPVSTIFIFLPFVPTLILHVTIEIYHQICFPIYGLKKLQHANYVRFDRERLTYLNLIQKIHCWYCAYMNGTFAYFVDIAGETEGYWCGIKHKPDPDFRTEPHQAEFAKYGDKTDFEEKYARQRDHAPFELQDK